MNHENLTRLPQKAVQMGVGLLVLILVLALAPSVALAHAKLSSSTPADGASVNAGLTTVTLNFSEELSPDQSTATLIQASGTAVAGATSAVDRANRTVETITTPALAAGKYTVKWHAVTEDDNGITDGSYSFTVVAEGTPATTDQTTTTTTTTQSPSTLPNGGSGQDGALLAALFAISLC